MPYVELDARPIGHPCLRTRDLVTQAAPFQPAEDPGLLAKVLDDAVKLCPLPATTQRVLQLADSDRASIATIVQAISNDPALAAAVLRVANSALYTGPKLAQLDAAVIRIGLRELRDLAAAMSLLASFRSRDGIQVILHDRSVLAGGIANKLAKVTSQVLPSTAATCGLLCEIGAMVCLAADGKEYAKLWKELGPLGVGRVEREMARYSVTSFEIGRRHMARNGVPDEVCEAVYVDPNMDTDSMTPIQKLTLLARQAAPLLLVGGRVGANAKLGDQLDTLALQIGFAKLSGRELLELFKESGILRDQSHR